MKNINYKEKINNFFVTFENYLEKRISSIISLTHKNDESLHFIRKEIFRINSILTDYSNLQKTDPQKNLSLSPKNNRNSILSSFKNEISEKKIEKKKKSIDFLSKKSTVKKDFKLMGKNKKIKNDNLNNEFEKEDKIRTNRPIQHKK